MSMMEELTIQNKEALYELKRRMAHEVPCHLRNDLYLYLRFLKARDFNVNMAEVMLTNHLNWRRANKIDTILQDFVPAEVDLKKLLSKESSKMTAVEKRNARMAVVINHLPLSRIGFDKDGAPVRYFEFGEMDSKGILKSVKKSECIKAVIQCFEEDVTVMKEQSLKLGKPIEQWTYILDFENYTFTKATHKPTLEALVALFVAYEANYPERLKAAYIINASVYFTVVFAFIKPLLSGATIKKITIFGKEGWQDELRKNIDLEVLPAFLGGKRTDPDGNPLCKQTVKHASIVPESYYLRRSDNKLSDKPGVQKLVVNRMSKVNLNLDVAEPGSLIEWEFETAGRDIGFCLMYKDDNLDNSLRELIPNQRIDTHLVSEAGMYQCDFPGTYILVFDNSYSWMHQKEIYCRVSVVNASELNANV